MITQISTIINLHIQDEFGFPLPIIPSLKGHMQLRLIPREKNSFLLISRNVLISKIKQQLVMYRINFYKEHPELVKSTNLILNRNIR